MSKRKFTYPNNPSFNLEFGDSMQELTLKVNLPPNHNRVKIWVFSVFPVVSRKAEIAIISLYLEFMDEFINF